MEENIETAKNDNKLYSPKKAILLFILFVVFVPFWESGKIILWETQRGASDSLFHSAVLSYANASERIKESLGLIKYSGNDFVLQSQITESPEIFDDNINDNIEEKIDIDAGVILPSASPIITNIENNKTQTESKPAETVASKAAAETKPTQTPKVYADKLEAPFRILIIGDSLISVSGGAGESLERELIKYKDTAVTRYGKVSSGLSRPDFFDWNSKARELISLYKPNTVAIMFGSNDAQSMTLISGAKPIAYGSDAWNKEYAARVSRLLDIFQENKVAVFWIGLPIMRDAGYSGRIGNLNKIYQSEVGKRQDAYYLSTWEMFSDANGNYAAFLPDANGIYKSARNSDGIHISSFGGNLFAKAITQKMTEQLKLEKK